MKLILDSYGTALLRKDHHLIVRNKEGTFDIDPEKVETILVSRGVVVSSDALILAIENSIDVIFTDKRGSVKGRVWSAKIGSATIIRRRQLEFTFSPKAVEWIKKIIMEKISNQIALLLAYYPDEKPLQTEFDTVINRLEDYRKKVETVKGDIIPQVAHTLRGWEGSASRNYFSLLGKILPEQYQSSGRSQHPARDLFNALLNYAYGILYGKIEAALVRAGIDPYVGVLHREEYNRPVLTYDVIEKYRIWADYVVVSLLQQEVFGDEAYSVDSQGAYWLEGLGKRILIQAMYDYLAEEVQFDKKKMSREKHIEKFASDLATMFFRFKISK